MSDPTNLPAVVGDDVEITSETLNLPGGQAALFEDPQRLLTADIQDLDRVAHHVASEAKPLLAQIRRVAGLIAWAYRCRLSDGDYGDWEKGYAARLGVKPPTLATWRDAVCRSDGLQLPAASALRSEAARAAKLALKNRASGADQRKQDAPDPAKPAPPPTGRADPTPAGNPVAEKLASPEPGPTPADEGPAPPDTPVETPVLVLPQQPTAEHVKTVIVWLASRGPENCSKVPLPVLDRLISLAASLAQAHSRDIPGYRPRVGTVTQPKGQCDHAKRKVSRSSGVVICEGCGAVNPPR